MSYDRAKSLGLSPLSQPAIDRISILEREKAELERQNAGIHAARMAYASEFPRDADGEPDVGSIHANIRELKRQVAELRKDAERYQQLLCMSSEEAAELFQMNDIDAMEIQIDAALAQAKKEEA